MKTQNLLGMDFCQKQVSGIHFELPGNELKEPPNTVLWKPSSEQIVSLRLANPNDTNAACYAH